MSFSDIASLCSSIVAVVTAASTLTFYLSRKHKVKRYIIDAISVVLITITLFSTIFAITAYATHPRIIVNKQTGISLPGRPAPTYSSSSQNDNVTPTPISTNYSALQPGPGCDKGGGTWTSQGIDNIACGTTLTINPPNSRGYLYLQLPNNKAFLPNNTIGIATALAGYGDTVGNCIGLAEQDANSGFLVEYCHSGKWSIYSVSNGGAINQTLDQGLTSTRATEKISLTFMGNKLSFSIDGEVHSVSISPIQPIKVAVTFFGSGEQVTITNFSYTA